MIATTTDNGNYSRPNRKYLYLWRYRRTAVIITCFYIRYVSTFMSMRNKSKRCLFIDYAPLTLLVLKRCRGNVLMIAVGCCLKIFFRTRLLKPQCSAATVYHFTEAHTDKHCGRTRQQNHTSNKHRWYKNTLNGTGKTFLRYSARSGVYRVGATVPVP